MKCRGHICSESVSHPSGMRAFERKRSPTHPGTEERLDLTLLAEDDKPHDLGHQNLEEEKVRSGAGHDGCAITEVKYEMEDVHW